MLRLEGDMSMSTRMELSDMRAVVAKSASGTFFLAALSVKWSLKTSLAGYGVSRFVNVIADYLSFPLAICSFLALELSYDSLWRPASHLQYSSVGGHWTRGIAL